MKLDRVGQIEKLCGEESRYSTSHVWFNAERGHLAATNGHVLMVCECPAEEGDVTGPITKQALETYRKFCKQGSRFVKLHAYKDTLVVEDVAEGHSESFKRPITGAFPDYDRIVPKFKDGTPPSVSFNPNLLKLIADAFPSDERGVGIQSVSLWLVPEHKERTKKQQAEDKENKVVHPDPGAIIVKAHHAGGIALLMPVRYCLDESEWNTKIPGKTVEAKAEEPKKSAEPPVAPEKKAVEPAKEADKTVAVA